MKCQSLFSREKNKKNIVSLLSAELTKRRIKINYIKFIVDVLVDILSALSV